MIVFDRMTFTYPGAARPVLRDVNLTVPEGELWLVLGHTGTGKSTLLRAVNGLVPHFTGGRLEGVVRVADRSTRDNPPRDLAEFVGMVGQDPLAGFVTDVVEDELAYTMENLGLPTDVMRRRVEDVVDLLGLQELRLRPLATLSSGQQQRVAIGSVLTASPRVLVLDEPTSALDPGAAEEVLAALTRLVHDLGLTVLVAEHRLERIVQYADRVVTLDGDGGVRDDTPEVAMSSSPVVPPVVGLGRVAGWTPVPLTVRDARRRAPELRARLPQRAPERPPSTVAPVLVSVAGVSARFGSITALDRVSFDVAAGEVVAIMGRNGAGKSTLLANMAGLRAPSSGRVLVGGDPPSALAPRNLVRRVALVPPDPGTLLYHETVAEEAVAADRDAGLAPGATSAALDRLLPGVDRGQHPRDLSEGQRLSVALAVVLGPEPPLLLLDEPTRGLDYGAKARLATTIRQLASSGHGIVIATHDVEMVAGVASRVIVLANGEVVADGAAREVVCHSPVFAPQVAKVLAPDEWLTVEEVAAALAS